MKQNDNKCTRCVGFSLQCATCKIRIYRHGKTTGGKQRYKCRNCNKTSIEKYTYQSYNIPDESITHLVKEGCGIRSISRLLKISITTVLRRIINIAALIIKPVISFFKTYEVDEMRTYYKSKGRLLWIVMALQRDTKRIIDFTIGSRTKATLQKVIGTLFLSNAEKIYTDKLNLYKFLIPAGIHSNKQYGTNNIERINLNVRTHLKRLSRRTICFSKSKAVLEACLRIYFWG